MIFLRAISSGFRNYANFKGYATRSEFWLWILFFALTAVIASALGTPFPANGAGPDTQVGIFTVHFGSIAWFELVQRLALLLPTLTVLVRRLRDAGYGWVHVFWIFLPIGGIIVLIALAASRSNSASPNAGSAKPLGSTSVTMLAVGLPILGVVLLIWAVTSFIASRDYQLERGVLYSAGYQSAGPISAEGHKDGKYWVRYSSPSAYQKLVRGLEDQTDRYAQCQAITDSLTKCSAGIPEAGSVKIVIKKSLQDTVVVVS